MASTISDIKYAQNSILLDSTKTKTNSYKTDKESEAIKKLVTGDILDLSAQVDLINSQKPDYGAIEKKLGLDSSQWGVEAVSDDIFNFAKIMYDSYKLNHKGEEDPKVLENFYNMAKDSITKGYNEARNFLGALPEDVATLAEGTFNRSIEKLDAWFKNGGKDVETSNDSAINENEKIPTQEKTPTNQPITTSQLLKESENLRNQVIKMLEDQGIFLKQSQEDKDKAKEKIKEQESQSKPKTSINIKA